MRWVIIFLWLSFCPCLVQAQQQISYLSAPTDLQTLVAKNPMPAQEIPFELVNGMLLVEASVDHKRGTFILDTGAPLVVLNQRGPLDPGKRSAYGCSGAVAVGTKNIRHFAWANQEKYQMDVLTADLQHLERATGRPITGLIGYPILREWEVLIDYDAQRLFLFQPTENRWQKTVRPLAVLPVTFQDHLPVVTMRIQGKELRLGLDTGSESNLIDAEALKTLTASRIDTIDHQEIQGLDKSIRTVPVVVLNNAFLEDLPIDASPFLVTEFSHLKSRTGLSIDGLLGFDFLRRVRFSINYQTGELYVWSWAPSM